MELKIFKRRIIEKLLDGFGTSTATSHQSPVPLKPSKREVISFLHKCLSMLLIFALTWSTFAFAIPMAVPQKAVATNNIPVTWDSESHFSNNGATNSNYTGATTYNSNEIVLNNPSGQAKLKAPTGGDTWVQRADIPGNWGDSYTYQGHILVYSTATNKIYGTVYSGSPNYNFRLYEYDPSSDNWTLKIDGGFLSFPGAFATNNPYNGKIYLSSGSNQDYFYEYNPSNNTLIGKATPPLGYNDRNNSMAALSSNIIYRFSRTYGMQNKLYEYNIGSNTWTEKSSPSFVLGAGLEYDPSDGKVYAHQTDSTNFWKYDVSNGWQSDTSTPSSLTNGSGNFGDRLTYAGGHLYSLAANGSSFYKFNTTTRQWYTKQSPPEYVVTGDTTYNSSNGKIYSTITWGASGHLYEYTPGSYPNSSTIRNLKINADTTLQSGGLKAKWNNISWSTASLPSGTSVKFRTRGADTEAGLASASWSSEYITTGSSISTSASQWLEVEANIVSNGGEDTPSLDNFTVTYDTIDAPTNPLQYRSNGTTSISANGWTNETSVVLKAQGAGLIDSTNPRVEFEVKESAQSFDGTLTTLGSVFSGGISSATKSGLDPTKTYKWRARIKDDQGRYSAWTNFNSGNTAINIELTPPTGTVSIDTTTTGYINDNDVTLTANSSDTGGSNISKMIFSNDGVNFGKYSDLAANGTISTDFSDDDSHWVATDGGDTYSWKLGPWSSNADDGSKTIYVKYKDAAGNISGKLFTLTADFSGTTLSSISTINDRINLSSANDLGGNLMLFWAGDTAPNGWTDVSASGQPFEGRFIMASNSYGSYGGSSTHNHTATTASWSSVEGNPRGDTIAPYASSHNHLGGSNLSNDSTALPEYKTLKVIRYNNGIPTTIPAGSIAIFESGPPSGWTRYTAQDGFPVYGSSLVAAGTQGGSSSHNHTADPFMNIRGWNDFSGTGTYSFTPYSHTHNLFQVTSGLSSYAVPTYTVIFAQANSDINTPDGMVAMLTQDPTGSNWTLLSGASQSMNNKLLKGSNLFGTSTTGGHSHSSSATTSGTAIGATAGGNTSGDPLKSKLAPVGHTHTSTVSFSNVNALPPYITTYIARKETPFPLSGTLGGDGTGLRIGSESGAKQKWSKLKWNAANLGTLLDDYKIKVQVRASDTFGSGTYVNPETNSSSTWKEITDGASGSIALSSAISATKTLEIRLEFTGDGNDTPILYDISSENASSNTIILDTQVPSVTANPLFPSVGENIKGGTTKEVRWTASDNGPAGLKTTPIDVYYSVDNGVYQLATDADTSSPAQNEANDGTLNWAVPSGINSDNVKLKVVATDKANNAGEGLSQTFTVDSTAPSVTNNTEDFLGPNQSAIHGTSSDNLNLNTTQLSVKYNDGTDHFFNGSNWSSGTEQLLDVNPDDNWSYDSLTGMVHNRTYTVRAESYDLATNTTSSSKDFTWDENAPEASIDNTGTYSDTTWPGKVTSTITDSPAGVSAVQVLIKAGTLSYNGVGWSSGDNWLNAVYNAGTSKYEYSVAANKFSDGPTYTVKFKATDNALNVPAEGSEPSSTFNFDKGPPSADGISVNFSNPTYTNASIVDIYTTNFVEGSPLTADMEITNTADANPPSSWAGNWEDYANPRQLWDITSEAGGAGQGTKHVWVRYKDFLGNISSEYSDSIIYDTLAPEGTVSIKSGDTYTNSLNNTLTLSATDTNPGANGPVMKFKVNSGSYTPSWEDYATSRDITLDDTQGTQTVYVNYRDAALNEGEFSDTIFVDTANPNMGTVSSSTHTDETGWFNNNDPAFSWSATDPNGANGSGVAGYSIAVDSTADDSIDQVGTDKNYTDLEDGVHTLSIKAIDNAGNVSSEGTYTFKIDTTVPGKVQNATANGTDSTQMTLTFEDAIDAGSGVKEYAIYRSSGLAGEPGDPPTLSYTQIAIVNADTHAFSSNEAGDTIDFASGTYTFVDNDLADQTWYAYRIKAIDKTVTSPAGGLEGDFEYVYSKTNTPPSVSNISVSPSSIDLSTVGAIGEAVNISFDAVDFDNSTSARVDFNTGNADSEVKMANNTTGLGIDGDVANWISINDAAHRTAITNTYMGYRYTYTFTVHDNIRYGTYTVSMRAKDSVGTGTHAITNTRTVTISPERPTNQGASGYSSSKIDINFARPRKGHSPVVLKAAEGVSSYNIYISADGADWSPPGLTSPVNIAHDSAYYSGVNDSYSLRYGEDEATESLDMDTTYYFKVAAVDEAGNEGADSLTFSAKTPKVGTPRSPAVKNVSNAETAEYRGFIYWSPPNNNINDFEGLYKLYRATDLLMSDAELVTTTSNRYALDLGLNPTDTYYYAVKSVDALGRLSDYSAISTVIPTEGADLTAPAISNIDIDKTANEANVSWGTDEESETLLQLGENGESKNLGRNIYGERTEHNLTIKSLKPYTLYDYIIVSRDSSGNKETESGSFRTERFRVSNVNVSTTVSTAIVRWNTNASARSFVEYGKTRSLSFETGSHSKNTTHRLILRNLKPGTRYYYEITSVDDYSNIATKATTSFTTKPFRISNISVSTKTNSATLSWNTNVDSTSVVEYKSGSDEKATVAGDSSYTKNHSVTLEGLKPATTYSFILKSVDRQENEARSVMDSFVTKSLDYGLEVKPNVSKINEVELTATSAKVAWTTAIEATSWVDYGLSTSYGKTAGNSNLSLDHVVTLENLTPGKTYHYRVYGEDVNGNEYKSSDSTFTALVPPEVAGKVTVNDVTANSAKVAWGTNTETSSIVEFGKTEKLGSSQGSSDLSREHEVILANLEQNTTYYLRVSGTTKTGEKLTSDISTFKTDKDTTGPKIGEVKTELLRRNDEQGKEAITLVVSFSTDEDATVFIEYAEGLSLATYNKKTDVTEAGTSHTVMIENLSPATTYHYRIVASDQYENITKGSDLTLLTPKESESILQKIIRTLEDAFSWVNRFRDYVGNKFSGK